MRADVFVWLHMHIPKQNNKGNSYHSARDTMEVNYVVLQADRKGLLWTFAR